MEQLSQTDEQNVLKFHGLLWGICCVEDMFPPDSLPPDTSGDREPRVPMLPHLPLGRQLLRSETELCLANIELALTVV